MTPQGFNQQNPDCGKLYRKNDLEKRENSEIEGDKIYPVVMYELFWFGFKINCEKGYETFEHWLICDTI